MTPPRRLNDELEHSFATIERELGAIGRIALTRHRPDIRRRVWLAQAEMRGIRAELLSGVQGLF